MRTDNAVGTADTLCDGIPHYVDDTPTTRMLPFANRFAAGRLLGRALEHHAGTDAVVLGLAHGGLVVAAGAAWQLSLPLDVWVARKLRQAAVPRLELGAIAEGAGVVIDVRAVEH